MTSSAFLPRRSLTLCSPRTQRKESATLDLPEPFGPTTAVMPRLLPDGGRNSMVVFSAKDLKPMISSFWRYIRLERMAMGVAKSQN